MAYKFQRGAATASGSFTADEGLTSNNALSVTAGTSTLQAVTATTLSASSTLQIGGISTLQALNAQGVTATTLSSSGGLQVGSSATIASGLTITSLGATITGSVSVSGSITSTGNISVTAGVLSASNAVQTAGPVVAGARVQGQTLTASAGSTLAATVVTTLTGSGLAQFESLTVNGGGAATLSNVVITGGTINGTTIGATTPSSVKATTLSASSTLQVAGITTLNNALTVSAGGLSVSSGDSSVQKLTVNGDLIVLGTTISASVQNLIIEDKQIVLADGAASAAAAAGAGFFVSGANVEWTYKQNGEGTAASSGDIFVASGSSGLKSIQASSFYGTFVGTMASPVTLIADAGTLAIGVNYFADVAGASSVTLPAAPSVGESVRVKAPSNCSTINTITVNRTGSQTIDGENLVVLESPYAAVEFVYVATNLWRIF